MPARPDRVVSRILVADDEESMMDMLEIMLKGDGYQVSCASSTDEAVSIIGKEKIDLIISDMNMPGGGGIALLKASLKSDSLRPVIMVTAYASTDKAVKAMKLGAFDYITKPFKVDEMKLIVRNGLERRDLIIENEALKTELRSRKEPSEIIGSSREITLLRETISRVAGSNATVLITGESGTGKELIARAIHFGSERRDLSFLTINCGAMPDQLLESELFGYAKGAFTGASGEKAGLLEEASGGTFFFDEIAEMPLPLQVKILRVLQERVVRRVGDVKEKKLDVRYVAATNKNVEESVEKGMLREDLYYRLNVVHIKAPALRDRKGDIPILAKYFLERFNAQNERSIKGFSSEAMKIMEEARWRGNVRELENVVERAVVLEPSDFITVESLPENMLYPGVEPDRMSIPSDGFNLENRLEEIEKNILMATLKKTNWSRKETARILGLNMRSLRYKLGKYEISL